MADIRLADTSFAQWLTAQQRSPEPREEAQEPRGDTMDADEGNDSGMPCPIPQCPRCGQYVGTVGHPCGCLA